MRQACRGNVVVSQAAARVITPIEPPGGADMMDGSCDVTCPQPRAEATTRRQIPHN
ncbi:hypothetical protein JYU34_021556, partial [Plutella xylostella]